MVHAELENLDRPEGIALAEHGEASGHRLLLVMKESRTGECDQKTYIVPGTIETTRAVLRTRSVSVGGGGSVRIPPGLSQGRARTAVQRDGVVAIPVWLRLHGRSGEL